MKTKLTIVIGVVSAAMFVLVPNAVSGKKVPPSGSLTVTCSSNGVGGDICSVAPVGGLSKSFNYTLEVADGCGVGGIVATSHPSSSQLAAGVTITVDDGADEAGCTIGTFSKVWAFSLYSSTIRGTPVVTTLVASGQAIDQD